VIIGNMSRMPESTNTFGSVRWLEPTTERIGADEWRAMEWPGASEYALLRKGMTHPECYATATTMLNRLLPLSCQ
jgi:hypothetical protein